MNQKSLELWKQRIADKKASGLKVADWCDKNNLTKHAYYYWMKHVKADIQKSMFQYLFLLKLNLNIHDIHLTVSDSKTAKLAAEFISQLQSLC